MHFISTGLSIDDKAFRNPPFRLRGLKFRKSLKKPEQKEVAGRAGTVKFQEDGLGCREDYANANTKAALGPIWIRRCDWGKTALRFWHGPAGGVCCFSYVLSDANQEAFSKVFENRKHGLNS